MSEVAAMRDLYGEPMGVQRPKPEPSLERQVDLFDVGRGDLAGQRVAFDPVGPDPIAALESVLVEAREAVADLGESPNGARRPAAPE